MPASTTNSSVALLPSIVTCPLPSMVIVAGLVLLLPLSSSTPLLGVIVWPLRLPAKLIVSDCPPLASKLTVLMAARKLPATAMPSALVVTVRVAVAR
jgi:hypothetical protein